MPAQSLCPPGTSLICLNGFGTVAENFPTTPTPASIAAQIDRIEKMVAGPARAAAIAAARHQIALLSAAARPATKLTGLDRAIAAHRRDTGYR